MGDNSFYTKLLQGWFLAKLMNMKMQVVVDPAPTLTPGQFSDSFNDFTSICLNKKAEDRASFSQLLEHAFLDSNKEVEVGAFFKEILHLET